MQEVKDTVCLVGSGVVVALQGCIEGCCLVDVLQLFFVTCLAVESGEQLRPCHIMRLSNKLYLFKVVSLEGWQGYHERVYDIHIHIFTSVTERPLGLGNGEAGGDVVLEHLGIFLRHVVVAVVLSQELADDKGVVAFVGIDVLHLGTHVLVTHVAFHRHDLVGDDVVRQGCHAFHLHVVMNGHGHAVIGHGVIQLPAHEVVYVTDHLTVKVVHAGIVLVG